MDAKARCRWAWSLGALAALAPGIGGSLAFVDRILELEAVPDGVWMEWSLIGLFGLLAAAVGGFAMAAIVGCFERGR